MDAKDLEVRCATCGAGFAIGTRRCIHCGQSLAARAAPEWLATTSDTEPSPEQDSPAENVRMNSIISGAVMISIVVASSLIRHCS
jgi:hypothetical protein